MKIENPLAYSFIMQDELYLLNNEKGLYAFAVSPVRVEAETPVIPLPVIETQLVNFNYLGNNKKAFLVVVNYANAEVMPDAHLTALTAVLSRLQYSIDDVAILNLAKYADTTLNTLIGYFHPQKLLFLGAKALPVGLAGISLNKPQKIGNIPALLSFGFDEMMADNERKKIFWEQMKQL